MNEREAELTFQKLFTILEPAELGWLLREVTEEVRQGKSQAKKVRPQASSDDVWLSQEIESTAGRPATFVESVAYSSLEKLDMFLCAIKRAIVQPIFMERDIAEVLLRASSEMGQTTRDSRDFGFEFQPDDGGNEFYRSTFDIRSRRKEVGEALLTSIERLRKEIHGPN